MTVANHGDDLYPGRRSRRQGGAGRRHGGAGDGGAPGRRRPSSIDEDALAAHLTAPDLPDPDLIVRTGGETTTTSFLVWQSAYSELVFTDVRWPASWPRRPSSPQVAEYQRRERRFGAVEPLP